MRIIASVCLLCLCLFSTSLYAKKGRSRAGEVNTAAPTSTVKVKNLHINPEGELDGFLTEENVLVKFPPHMSDQLASVVHVGDSVRVEGVSEPEGDLKAFAITNLASNQRVVEEAPPEGRMPKHLRARNMKDLTAQGNIEKIFRAKRGEIREVLLSDGTFVRIPREAENRFSGLLQPGAKLAVKGLGTENQYGRSLEATALGPSMADVRPIFSERLAE